MIFPQTKLLKFIFLCLLFWILESNNFTSVCLAQSELENETKIDTVLIAHGLPPYIIKHTFPRESSFHATVNRFDIFQINNPKIHQTILDTGDEVHNFELVDINFDGYNDLKIEAGNVEYSEFSTIYLFDTSKMIFVFNEEFSGHPNLSVNPNKQEINTFEQFFRGRESEECSYKFLDGHLKMIYRDHYSENVSTIENLVDDSLIVVKRIIISDDSINTPTFTTYERVDDTLQIVSKITKVGFEYATDDQKRNGVNVSEEHLPWFLLKEKIYDYSTDEHGKKFVDITIKEAKAGKWVMKKHQRIPR